MRYCFRLENPKNRNFVAMWEKEYGTPPDNNEGEQWQALSQSSWLVGGVLPGIERQPRKKLEPSPERLLALVHRWRDEALGAVVSRRKCQIAPPRLARG